MKSKHVTSKRSSSPRRRTSMVAALAVALIGLFSTKTEAGPGGALNFDGMNTYVDIGIVLPGGHSYTKEAWIKANQSSTHNIITGDDDPFWLSGDHLRAAHGWQRIPSDIQDPETFPLGEWVYVAVTYDAATTTMRLYKNGVEVASSTSMLPANTTYLQVGAYNSSNLFDGDIDEVRVWDRALCIGELQAHMNGELTGSENGLIVYYKMNDGILGALNTLLTNVTDASGHNNNGSLHNFPLVGSVGNFVQGIVTGNANVFTPPTATATPASATTVPMGSTVSLSANASAAYQWKKDAVDIDGATAQTYNASTTGDYSVMVTIDNGCTNVSTPVHVTVNAVATPLTAPADITACNNQNGNSKTLTLSTAGITSPTVTYAITGATTGTGTGATVTKNFNVGVSTVTWTVTDAVNGTRKCASTVTILELPTATISTSKPDAFCNELAVMAKSSHTTTTAYTWTYNNATYASSQIINLDNSKNDGNYYVKVTDQNGCQSNSASYNYQKQNMANSYTLLAYKSIDLGSNNDVLSGAIGVMNWGGDIDMDWSGSVPSSGWAKASYLDISCYATVSRKYYSQASNIALPAMVTGNTTAANNLSNYTKTSSGTVTNNYKTLTINSYVNATVKGTMYHKIKIGSNATVTFTAADISLDSLDISYGAKVIFNQNTIIRVSKAVTMDDRIVFNSAGKKVTFYMSDGVSDVIKFDVGNNCNITANVFMPKGKLNVNDASNNDCWKTANNCRGHRNNCNNNNTGTFMIGYFIAERINAGTNVTWDNFTCVDIPVERQNGNKEAGAVFTANEIASVNVFPNPNNGTFRVALPSMTGTAVMNVYDITGKLIISKDVPQADAQILDVNIADAAKGVYIVQVKGGGIDAMTKMIVE